MFMQVSSLWAMHFVLTQTPRFQHHCVALHRAQGDLYAEGHPRSHHFPTEGFLRFRKHLRQVTHGKVELETEKKIILVTQFLIVFWIIKISVNARRLLSKVYLNKSGQTKKKRLSQKES